MAFKPINTQEEFEDRVKTELEKEIGKVKDSYKEFLSPEQVEERYKNHLTPEQVEERYKDYLSPEQVAGKDARIRELETEQTRVRVAINEGLPYELATRISGDTEEDMIEDAQKIAGYVTRNDNYPSYSRTEGETDERRLALKNVLKGING